MPIYGNPGKSICLSELDSVCKMGMGHHLSVVLKMKWANAQDSHIPGARQMSAPSYVIAVLTFGHWGMSLCSPPLAWTI